ncbi:hypothetical protein [Paracoccus aestuariivivens]|uniref:Uncharacterized protein n=1 Tax=Paracoccus aestuariivivens TaxID=1820333 RepID=A0A6L6JFI3_9RHOB|nr:hypothetical protein [Paracoccus aestuariivivens]MTH80025.1 hypothetical protein [Paracoccus aestuariivivens]
MTVSHILQGGILFFAINLTVFCCLLVRRLRKLNDLETGLGGAIAVMTSEISRLEHSIHSAKTEALLATHGLAEEIEKAKKERAYWTLQKQFAESAMSNSGRVRRKKRVISTGTVNA